MSPASHYQTLGLGEDASAEEIRKAYRKAAKELHPDRNPEGGAAFRRVTGAYEVLNDTEAKVRYDSTLCGPTLFQSQSHQRAARQPPPPAAPPPAARTGANTAFSEYLSKTKRKLFSDLYRTLSAHDTSKRPAPPAPQAGEEPDETRFHTEIDRLRRERERVERSLGEKQALLARLAAAHRRADGGSAAGGAPAERLARLRRENERAWRGPGAGGQPPPAADPPSAPPPPPAAGASFSALPNLSPACDADGDAKPKAPPPAARAHPAENRRTAQTGSSDKYATSPCHTTPDDVSRASQAQRLLQAEHERVVQRLRHEKELLAQERDAKEAELRRVRDDTEQKQRATQRAVVEQEIARLRELAQAERDKAQQARLGRSVPFSGDTVFPLPSAKPLIIPSEDHIRLTMSPPGNAPAPLFSFLRDIATRIMDWPS
ncbi:Chaperone protein DnaJ [Diplonema papillatum]|nr:Chaperone protein DnaJ [Diplonema papillatum]